MFEKFSEEAIRVIMLAEEEARTMKHSHVGPEHLLLGLFAIGPDSASHKFISSYGLDLAKLRKAVEKKHKKGAKASPSEMPFDTDAKIVLQNSFREILCAKQALIYSEHLLLGLFAGDDNAATRVLEAIGIERHGLRQTVYYRIGANQCVSDDTVMTQVEAEELFRDCPQVIAFALEEAYRLKLDWLDVEMILLGLIGAGGSVSQVLKDFGIELDWARKEVENLVGHGSGPVMLDLPFTLRAKKMLQSSLDEAFKLGHDTLNPRHLLLGLVREQEGVAFQILTARKVNLVELRQAALALFDDK